MLNNFLEDANKFQKIIPENLSFYHFWYGENEAAFEWITETRHAYISFDCDGVGYTYKVNGEFVPGNEDATCEKFPDDLLNYLKITVDIDSKYDNMNYRLKQELMTKIELSDEQILSLVSSYYNDNGQTVLLVSEAARALKVAIKTRNAQENDEGYSSQKSNAYDKEFGESSVTYQGVYIAWSVLGDSMLDKLLTKISDSL